MGKINAQSVDDCCALCSQRADCDGYVFHLDQCYLKKNLGAATAKLHAMTRVKSICGGYAPPLPDIDMSGVLLAKLWAADMTRCCSLCDSTSGCEGYVFHLDQCYLKRGLASPSTKPGATTRLKYGNWSDASARTTPSPSSSIAVSTTSQSTSATMGATCKLNVRFCRLSGYNGGSGYSSSWMLPTTTTLPLPEDWELNVGECSPDGRGGAYKVRFPDGPHYMMGGCDDLDITMVYVDHYPEESCRSVPAPIQPWYSTGSSSFAISTDGDCGGRCCDIRTGVCKFGCGGRLSRAYV